MRYLTDYANFSSDKSNERQKRKRVIDIGAIALAGAGGAAAVGGNTSTVVNMIASDTPPWATRVVKSGALGTDLSKRARSDEIDLIGDLVSKRKVSRRTAKSLLSKVPTNAPAIIRPLYDNEPVLAGALRAASLVGLVGGAGLAMAATNRSNESRDN